MDQEHGGHYSYALRYAWLTSVYDPVVRWTCRETEVNHPAEAECGERQH